MDQPYFGIRLIKLHVYVEHKKISRDTSIAVNQYGPKTINNV